MREQIESRNEKEDGEQRREKEKSTDKMREMRDRGERVEIKYIIFDTIAKKNCNSVVYHSLMQMVLELKMLNFL